MSGKLKQCALWHGTSGTAGTNAPLLIRSLLIRWWVRRRAILLQIMGEYKEPIYGVTAAHMAYSPRS